MKVFYRKTFVICLFLAFILIIGGTAAAGTKPVANFDYSNRQQYNMTIHEVEFWDTSTGIPTSWSWAFGDGTYSTVQNPVHEYPAAGDYMVTLIVRNSWGSSISFKEIYVN